MSTPQQPELARSGRSSATPERAAKSRVGGPTATEGPTGPVPEDNLPGHRPPRDQDKPEGPPRRRPAQAKAKAKTKTKTERGAPGAAAPASKRFAFRFDASMAPLSTVLGVRPENAYVEIDGDELRIRFGRWSLTTPVSNVAGAERTGPYQWWKVAGPARLSLMDRGVTFATSTRAGVCIQFHEPVAGALPVGVLKHPAATVTVADPGALLAAIDALTRGRATASASA